MNNWATVKLKEISTKIGSGATPRGGKGAYKESGISLIRSLNIYDFEFSYKDLAFINDDQATELSSVEVVPGDILLNITGASVARCCMVPTQILPARVNQHVAIIRVSPDIAYSKFVLYTINCPTYKRHILSLAQGGATREALTKTTIENFEIRLPPLPMQHKIAAILSAYDDLIENNTRRIHILEEIAQSIYREWFVHFRFPGHEDVKMVESELGMIPEGWEEMSLFDIPDVRFIRENIQQYSGEKYYFATANISGNEIIKDGELFSYDKKPSRAQKEPKINTVWFARMKDTHKVLCFTKANEEFVGSSILSSGMAGFATNEQILPFLYLTINPRKFHKLKNQYCTGATQMAITNQGIKRINVLYPNRPLLIKFGEITLPIINLQIFLKRKSEKLRKTRDLLLPRLVSGELYVSEMEIEVV